MDGGLPLLRFAAMYSSQIRRKKKAWQDGEAVYNPRKCRLTLKDDSGASIASHWVYKQPQPGDEVMFESHIVQIEHVLDVLEASQPVIIRTTPLKLTHIPEDSLQRVLNGSGPTQRLTPSFQPMSAVTLEPTEPLEHAQPTTKRSRLWVQDHASDYDLRIEDETFQPVELVSSRPASKASLHLSDGSDAEQAHKERDSAGGEDDAVQELEPVIEPEEQSLQEIISSQALNPLNSSPLKASPSPHNSPTKPLPAYSVPSPEAALKFPVFSDPKKRQKGQPSLMDLLGPSKQVHSLQHTADSLKAKNASLESLDCEIIYSKKKRTDWLRDVPEERPDKGPWTWEAYWLVSWRPPPEVKQEQL